MAIKRIDYYGRFDPTPVDESTARKFQALAGLASDVGKTALAIGGMQVAEKQRIAKIEGEKAGTIAGFEAAKERDQLQLKEDYSDASQTYNAAAQAAYIAGTKTDLASLITESEAEYPDDIQAFQQMSQDRFVGLTGNMPEELKPELELYYSQINQQSANRVIKAQKKIINENNRAIFDEYTANQTANITNLARSNDIENLSLAKIEFLKEGQRAVAAGIIDPTDFGRLDRANNQAIVEQLAIGEFEGLVINGDGTPQERIDLGKRTIEAIKTAGAIQYTDPADPESKLTLDAEQTDKVITRLESELESFKQSEIKKAEEALHLSEFEQIENYKTAMDTVMDTTMTDDKKLVEINKAEMLGNIRPSDAVLLRRYVNSAQKLNAVTNSNFVGDIIARAYDLNASYDYDANGNNYLQGMNNLQAEILSGAANGQLSPEDEQKLTNMLRGLTSAKKAGATVAIADNFAAADRTIQTSLSPDLWGVARRELFDKVNIRKQELEEESGKPLTRSQELGLWKELAPGVVGGVKERQRQKAMQTINRVTSQTVTTIPVITTQAQYDALPSGAKFIENGVTYQKP
jgi:hypothetical protein